MYRAPADYMQDRPCTWAGIGDYGHECDFGWLPLYHPRNILHDMNLNALNDAKVVVRNRCIRRLCVTGVVTDRHMRSYFLGRRDRCSLALQTAADL